MKKNRDADALAARISAAVSQPAGALLSPASLQHESHEVPAIRETQRSRAKQNEPDTVPITLRPSSSLLNKYVLKASERTREEGRVISAQHIMLEVLERSDV